MDTTSGAQGDGPADGAAEAAVRIARRALDAYPGGMILLDGLDRPLESGPRSDALLAALDRESRGGPREAGAPAEGADGLPAPLPASVRVLTARARETGGAVEEILSLPGENGPAWFRLTVLPLADAAARVLLLARDVTLERTLRAALVESRQRYKDFVEISTDFAWETGADGTFIFVSPRGALGHPAQRLVGRPPDDLVADYFGPGEIPFLTREPLEDVDVWLRGAAGSVACVRMSATPLFAPDGSWMGARGVGRDVTRERERDAALSRARNRDRILTYVVRAIRDEVDPGNMLAVAAETLGRGLGATVCQIFRLQEDRERDGKADAVPAADGTVTFVPGARWGDLGYVAAGPVLDRLRQRMGRMELEIGDWLVMAIPTFYRQALNGAVVLWRQRERGGWGEDDRLLIADIASQLGIAMEQITNHEHILRMSRTDALTGLFNRRAFFEEVDRRFRRLERDRSPAALIYLDLDNFKLVNDLRGHQTGDRVLHLLRDTLLGNTRPTDLVARLGGDEFAVWLEGATVEIAEAKARRLIEAAQTLRQWSGRDDRPLSLSLGVAVHDPARPETLAEMLARADEAMYSAKHTGKNAYRVAPPARPLAAVEPTPVVEGEAP
ncbi:diguanylate cyclase domain-containing protein [Caenispirillum bisanense]|uniref:PAS domain S-box-containing protein/diguanylate cyclase (GGDEF) domain-containing protein n=1 Tax=Caenispirillum bisanense TaxID=414052 RepID=A0A286G9A1_9PROT|nr:diguanylate cyclase [Caenispirillum bisanense]SOD92088.1 PAS domain S-box-containing protein/diguanylate cyclase (GGDEF) domain-containing protein [Caenispirillum bisanense]